MKHTNYYFDLKAGHGIFSIALVGLLDHFYNLKLYR